MNKQELKELKKEILKELDKGYDDSFIECYIWDIKHAKHSINKVFRRIEKEGE